MREESSIHAAVDAAIGESGRIDILINNAGCNIRKPALGRFASLALNFAEMESSSGFSRRRSREALTSWTVCE